jgi:hypothetical protein
MVEICVKHHDPDPYPEPNPDPYSEPEHSVNQKDILKDHTKALNIPLTLTQGGLLQEALAVTVAKDHTQALNIPVKVPLGGGTIYLKYG